MFPSGQSAITTNLASGTNDPSLARINLYDALVLLNDIIDSENTSNGVLVLNSFGKITASMIPNTVNPSGEISLEPTDKVVNIKYIQRLVPQTVAQLEAMSTTFVSGDMAMVSDAPDGASTGPAVCFYNGTDWKFMLFSGLTTL